MSTPLNISLLNVGNFGTSSNNWYWEFTSTDTTATTHTYLLRNSGNILGNDYYISYNWTTRKWFDSVINGSTWFFDDTSTASNVSARESSANLQTIYYYAGPNQLGGGHSNPYYDSTWSSGPTVTSITRNESNNLITVLHTGTLTSSDVNHTISNVSSSITNLQTITNGSTFTASSANGTHVIQINDEILTYFIYNTTSARTTMSSDNNLIVTFPTTDNAWLSNFSALNSETLTPGVNYSDTKTAIRLAVMDYTMWITFNLSYNATQEGYSVLTQIYDWRNTNSSNNYAHEYSSTLQWVYPEATFESTGSADTLITLPTNEIVTSFNWNFASVSAPVTTTSNGGGKRRRYPIISTNLFDRQKSIYSIGLTHKDDTLF